MKKLFAVTLAVILMAGCAVLWAQGQLRTSPDAQQTDPPKKQTEQPPAKDPKTKPEQPTAGDKAKDEKAVLEALYAFKEAFNSGDAEAIAKYFTPEAELVGDSGQVVHGRDAILKEYAAFFKRNPGARLDVNVDWFRWVSPEVIIGHGKAKVTMKNAAAFSMTYTAVHLKQDGKWQVAMFREATGQAKDKEGKAEPKGLQDLEWMVGDWVDADDSGTLKIHCKWSRNKAYLVRSFTVTTKKDVELEGTEIIAWDASRGALRSWIFDTNGGFSEGTWRQKGKSWFCTLAGVHPDGKKASAVHILTPQGDHYTFQSIGRTLEGELQPDIDEAKVRRVPSSEK